MPEMINMRTYETVSSRFNRHYHLRIMSNEYISTFMLSP